MFSFISEMVSHALETFDESMTETPAHQVVLATAALCLLYQYVNNPWVERAVRARHNKTLKQRALDVAYDYAQYFPPVRRYVDGELNKNLHSIREKLATQRAEMMLQDRMPEKGQSVATILRMFGIDIKDCRFNFDAIDSFSAQCFTVKEGDGQDSGALYAVHPLELTELLKEVYGQTALSNPLHEKWPRINAMQAEIIQWCQQLFHGSKQGYGLLTHGGTTSIIEAISAYVKYARDNGNDYPEIVVPETAHAAFKKAADLTGATLVIVPVDKETGAVSASTMRWYLSRYTAVMVGSAPSFMNGIQDPIRELGRLARQSHIPFHVDACLGGFLTAFLDTSAEPMDFRIPGVTSISADMHKYGYCPKGTSVCLFSEDSPALSVYAALNWSGGLYATPGILDGSTSGARVAEVYATLSYYGQEKYQEITRNIISLRERLQFRISQLSQPEDDIHEGDFYVYGDPKWSVLGFRSDTLNPQWVADEMEKRAWKFNLLQNPNGCHFCLTHVHTLIEDFEDKFMHDLKQAIMTVKSYPKDMKPSGNVKVYGAIEMMPTSLQQAVGTAYQKARLSYESSSQKMRLFARPKAASDEPNEHLRERHVPMA